LIVTSLPLAAGERIIGVVYMNEWYSIIFACLSFSSCFLLKICVFKVGWLN
jgi:hypothetical protein